MCFGINCRSLGRSFAGADKGDKICAPDNPQILITARAPHGVLVQGRQSRSGARLTQGASVENILRVKIVQIRLGGTRNLARQIRPRNVPSDKSVILWRLGLDAARRRAAQI